jgi:hypothetical protein
VPRSFALVYVAAWVAATSVAIFFVARSRRDFALLSGSYLRSLTAGWKIVLFGMAASFFVFAAPYTGDPTWDRFDGAMMSVLTFLTAPWAVGTLARVRRGKSSRKQVYVAFIALMVSASWCYDGYLFLRDGRYPSTWYANIAASGTMYIGAGMLFSLTHVKGRGIVFDFMTDEWFALPRAAFRKVALIAMLLVLGVALAMLPFVREVVRAAR